MIPRSALIKKSSGCLDSGLASLIPLLGPLAAILALVEFKQVVIETNDRWNPARPQLYVGALLAVLSLLAHALVAVLIYLKFIRDYLNA